MATGLAWSLFALGVAHIAYGVWRFRSPLSDAVAAGFVGQFAAPEDRRTAFWFLSLGPLLMLTGQVACDAAATGNLGLLRLIGYYLLGASGVGVLAFPRSPLWLPLALSPFFLAAGYDAL